MAAPIDPKKRAEVLAQIATGVPIATAAKRSNIARSTLIKWIEEERLNEPVATQLQRDQLGDAIDAWMVKAIQALTVQLDLAMDLDWLRGHSPAEFASLIAVLAEQVARVGQVQQIGQAEASAPTPMRRAS